MTSLGWVSPPHFFLKKTGDLYLVITVSQFSGCHPYLFLPEKLTTFYCSSLSLLMISLGCHPPRGVTPHLFYLSDLVYPLFFVNLPIIFFLWASRPWRVSTGAVHPPPPPSDATGAGPHLSLSITISVKPHT